MTRLAVAVVAAWAATVSAAAPAGRTFHVDCAAGDDAASGASAARAWRSLARVNRAMATLGPGDTVALKAGTTCAGHLAVTRSGTAARPLTFTRYGEGPNPIIDPLGAGGCGIAVGTDEVAVSHVVLDGLSVHNTRCRRYTGRGENGYAGGELVSCPDGGEREGDLDGAMVDGISLGSWTNRGGGHHVVRNAEIVNTGYGINVFSGENVIGPGNRVHDLRMQDQGAAYYGAGALLVESSGNEVFGNRFEHLFASRPGGGHDGSAYELFSDRAAWRVDRNVFHHNWTEASDTFFENTCKGTCVSLAGNVWHHEFARTHGNPGGTWHAGARMRDNRVERCTFVAYPAMASYQLIWFEDAEAAAGTAYTRNVVVLGRRKGAGRQVAYEPGHYRFTHADNVYWRLDGSAQGDLGAGFSFGPGERFADPRFVDPARDDFRLQPGAADAGAFDR